MGVLRLASVLALALSTVALGGCGAEQPARPSQRDGAGESDLPRGARSDTVRMLREDLAAERHPSDGGGRAWLELGDGESGVYRAATAARFSFLYEAGPLGIREGGALYFQVSPFWGWSSPQRADPRRAGYTTLESLAEGVELDVEVPGASLPGLVVATVKGRALVAGERVRLVYGDGASGAVVDRHAERRSKFWFAVDGDGDGVRKLIDESPHVTILAGPPALLHASVSSSARTGGSARVTVAVLDLLANAGVEVAGRVRLRSLPAGLDLPAELELLPEDRGRRSADVTAAESGVFRVHAALEHEGETLETISNPIWVSADARPFYWADLHGHSGLSDGTGLPEDYFLYARDVAALDVAVLTDHDHFGIRFLDRTPAMWDEIREAVQRFHEPGRFVTLLGYEWTSWIHGHRHVLYFADEGEVLSSLDPAYETPAQLWKALRGLDAMTLAHHSAGGPIPTDWSFAPDPVLEPLTEIMSVHGSSEAADSPSRIASAFEGNYVRDALDRGYVLGFVGSGDGHDGHPGLTHLSPLSGHRRARPAHSEAGVDRPARMGHGGLAAIRAEELTRPALLTAMRQRRTYATSGPRILLETAWNGRRMGSRISAAELRGESRLVLRLSGTAPIEAIDLVRSGRVVERTDGAGLMDLELALTLDPAAPGEYVYWRVLQRDGGLAWSSPFFVE